MNATLTSPAYTIPPLSAPHRPALESAVDTYRSCVTQIHYHERSQDDDGKIQRHLSGPDPTLRAVATSSTTHRDRTNLPSTTVCVAGTGSEDGTVC